MLIFFRIIKKKWFVIIFFKVYFTKNTFFQDGGQNSRWRIKFINVKNQFLFFLSCYVKKKSGIKISKGFFTKNSFFQDGRQNSRWRTKFLNTGYCTPYVSTMKNIHFGYKYLQKILISLTAPVAPKGCPPVLYIDIKCILTFLLINS